MYIILNIAREILDEVELIVLISNHDVFASTYEKKININCKVRRIKTKISEVKGFTDQAAPL